MTDQLDDLFADLRAGALPTVRPPGADAARRTVRRRRRTRLVAAAAAVLALAGGVAWAVRPAERPIPAAASPIALLTSARAAVDRSAVGPAIATRAWEFDGVSPDVRAGVSLPAGAYLLVVACASNAAGESLATVAPRDHAEPYVARWVPCSSAPTALVISFRVPKSSVTTVSIGTNITVGPTGYSFQVVHDPADTGTSSAASRANAFLALDRIRAAGVGGSSQAYTSEQDLAVWEGKFHRGTVALRVSCVGPGTVRVTARWLGADAGPADDPLAGPVLAGRTVSCAARTPTKLTLVLPAEGSVGIELIPDAAARNQAGYATVIV